MAWLESRRNKHGWVTWFVFWREGGRGTAKRCLKAGRRRRDADRLAVEIQARVNAGLVGAGVIAKRVVFDDFADKWLTLRLARTTTLRRDASLINTYLRPTFSGRMLHAIAVEDVRTLLAKVARRRSPSTARRLLSVLNQMFADAVRSDYVRQNPVAKLGPRDRPRLRKIQRTIDLQIVYEILEALPDRWSTFVLVAALTGLRWGEIAALEWSDIDLENEKIHVRRAIPAGTHGPQELKSVASWRSVDMLWPVWQSLHEIPHGPRYVFPGARGGSLNHGWFTKHVWLPGTNMLGGHRIRFHDLRHAFASLLLAWGEPILYVSRQLGHSDPSLALATYGHLLEQGRRLDKGEVLHLMFEASHRWPH